MVKLDVRKIFTGSFLSLPMLTRDLLAVANLLVVLLIPTYSFLRDVSVVGARPKSVIVQMCPKQRVNQRVNLEFIPSCSLQLLQQPPKFLSLSHSTCIAPEQYRLMGFNVDLNNILQHLIVRRHVLRRPSPIQFCFLCFVSVILLS